MKKNRLLFLFLLLSSVLQAQVPEWTVNPNDYQYSMSLTAFLNIDGEDLTSTDDQVAAFVDGECRGVSQLIYVEAMDRYLAYLTIYSNTVNEQVSFKLYRANDEKQADSPLVMDFEVDQHYGDVFQAKSIASPLLNSEAKFLSVNLGGVEILSQEVMDHEITVMVDFDQAIDALTPTFELSEGAKVYKNRVLQDIGSQPLDYTSPHSYDILSEDQSTLESYQLTIKKRAANTDSELLSFFVANPLSEIEIGTTEVIINVPYGANIEAVQIEFEVSNQATMWLGDLQLESGVSVIDLNEVASLLVRSEDLAHETNYTVKVRFKDFGINTVATNVITPNGDGQNDYWIVRDISTLRNAIFKIHDTNGTVLFETVGYNNDWAGTYKGKKLPRGNYFYSIKASESQEHFTGSILIHY